MPWKLSKKLTETKTEVSIDSSSTHSLTNNCVQENLPGNQVVIVSPAKEKEHTSVKSQVAETKPEEVRGSTYVLPTF